MDFFLKEFRLGVVAEASVLCPEVTEGEAVEVVFVRGIAERTVVGVVGRLDADGATGADEAVKLLHSSHDVGDVFDDVDGAQAIESAVGKGVGEAVEVAEDVGVAGGIKIDSERPGELFDTAADVEDSCQDFRVAIGREQAASWWRMEIQIGRSELYMGTMDWYYAEDEKRRGPVGEGALANLARAGVLTLDSLVWHGGMADWEPYRVAVSRTGEASRFEYGGFWVRFAAYLVDGLLIEAIQAVVFAPLGWHMVNRPMSIWTLKDLGDLQVSAWAIALCYFVFFWTRYGATPGKMIFGLKVVTPEGLPISAGQAVGRFFGTFVSFLILGLGFVMAAWDRQKRTLHDMMANTRVIRERR